MNSILKRPKKIAVVTIDMIKPYKDIQKYATDSVQTSGVKYVDNNDNELTIDAYNTCRKLELQLELKPN